MDDLMKEIMGFFTMNDSSVPATDFSNFFYNASSRQKKKLLKHVVKEANKDQRDLVERYNKSKDR